MTRCKRYHFEGLIVSHVREMQPLSLHIISLTKIPSSSTYFRFRHKNFFLRFYVFLKKLVFFLFFSPFKTKYFSQLLSHTPLFNSPILFPKKPLNYFLSTYFLSPIVFYIERKLASNFLPENAPTLPRCLTFRLSDLRKELLRLLYLTSGHIYEHS